MELKKNIFEICGKTGIGYLSNGNIFLFDSEDFDKIKDYYWSSTSQFGYVFASNKEVKNRHNKSGLLHRFLLNCKKGQKTDHKNHCPSDNRKTNIRISTVSQNSCNRNVRGYSWDESARKWRVQITHNRKNYELGYYEKEEDAIQVRRKAEIRYYGDFRFLLPVPRKPLHAGKFGRKKRKSEPVTRRAN